MSQTQTIDAGKVGQELLTAGRNLWLAGLGAVAGVVDADRESRALFDRLVERGRPMEERRRVDVEAWSQRTGETFREFGKLVQDTFEYEGKNLLKRLGIATEDDFKLLADRLDLLAKNVEELVARRKIEKVETAPPAELAREARPAKPATPVKTPKFIETTAAGTPKRGGRRAAKEA